MNKILVFIRDNKKVCIIGVSVLVILTIVLFITLSCSKKDKRTEEDKIKDSLKALAIKYYEEQYYPNIGGSEELDDKRAFLNEFRYNGIKFKLKLLLKYKEEINYSDGIEYKNSKTGNECNIDNSSFIITPYDPYGVKDYKIDILLDCGF